MSRIPWNIIGQELRRVGNYKQGFLEADRQEENKKTTTNPRQERLSSTERFFMSIGLMAMYLGKETTATVKHYTTNANAADPKEPKIS